MAAQSLFVVKNGGHNGESVVAFTAAEIQLLSTFLCNNVYCSVYSLSRPE